MKTLTNLFIRLFLLTAITSAQWSSDPSLPQLMGTGVQSQVAPTSDGGVYIAWLTDGNYHVYIQRLDAAGEIQLDESGLLVSDNNNSSWIAVYHLNLVVDGNDNAIITTVDQRTGTWEVYAWKIAPDGSMPWGQDGVTLTNSGLGNMSPRVAILPDNSVVVTWTHNDNSVLFQRISSDGTLLWGDGILMEDDDADLMSPQPIITVEGDVLIQWIRQSGAFPWAMDSELYLQKYDYDGNPQWSDSILAAGPVVFPMGNWSQQLVAEASGGSFLAWTQMSGNVQNAVAQLISVEGVPVWTGGVDLSTNSSNFRMSPMISVAEETQELMAVWREANGSQSQRGIFAQRLDSSGNQLWGSTGTTVVALNSSYDYLDLSVAGFGEEIISAYIQQSANMSGDIYAKRLDAEGNSVWTDEMVTVTNSGTPKSDMMTSKGPNCLFIAWSENGSVYAHCLREDGTLGAPDTETNVNFSFDLSCYHGIFEALSGGYTPYIKGNWNNWDNSIPMSDEDGDHIWTASANLHDGEYIFYVYATGPSHYFTLLAPVGSECDYYHDDPYGNWGFEINDSTGNELNLPTYSPNSCGECSTNEYFYLTHDGHERFYIVHLPDGYEDLNEDVPLILNLHAYSKYALYQQLMTGMEYWSDMQNVITVYPEAIPGPGGVRAWNCGINGNPDFPTPDVDDVGFISALIDTLVENYAIDPDRIYSCGISNGGFMSYKLACELNDKITAIGSVTGTFAESDADECSIERFMPVMDFHGTYDTVVPYEGAEGWMSVDETVAFWTGHNETDTYETYEYPDIVTGDNSTVNRFTYTNSSNNVQVVQYQIVGGGHEWPGAGYNYGWNNYDINAGVELIDFFLQYRLSDFLYVNDDDLLPPRFSLHQNYPNPFNPVTTLSYDLPEDALVNITIYDMMGRQVSTLVNSQQSAGYKSVQWNATNNAGQPVSAGLYLYTIQAREFRQTRKMVLLK